MPTPSRPEVDPRPEVAVQTPLSPLRTLGYGLAMGVADALPGVSGGTVALLLGYYARLIAAITAFTPPRVLTVLGGWRREARPAARQALRELDLVFLFLLGIGAVAAVALVAGAVSVLADTHPVALFGFFTGLIAASAVALYRDLSLRGAARLLVAGAGVALALLVASGVLQLPGSGRTLVFLSGVLAISAMILPGISGSLILILLGQYVFLSGELSSFIAETGRWVAGEGALADMRGPGITVALFIGGGLVGLISVARIVRGALSRAPELTLIFLVSLVAGSIPAPLLNIRDTVEVTGGVVLETAVWTGVGALLLLVMDRLAGGFSAR
ncbi:MAG: DUF368 domain-containing protein [Gemmatimonadales bacterium]|nr:MAG: DUF368 domain-containing protein [Gemmatimonadales bacterium]